MISVFFSIGGASPAPMNGSYVAPFAARRVKYSLGLRAQLRVEEEIEQRRRDDLRTGRRTLVCDRRRHRHRARPMVRRHAAARSTDRTASPSARPTRRRRCRRSRPTRARCSAPRRAAPRSSARSAGPREAAATRARTLGPASDQRGMPTASMFACIACAMGRLNAAAKRRRRCGGAPSCRSSSRRLRRSAAACRNSAGCRPPRPRARSTRPSRPAARRSADRRRRR